MPCLRRASSLFRLVPAAILVAFTPPMRAAADTSESLAARLLAAGREARAQQLASLEGDLPAVTRALIASGDRARAEAEFPRAVDAYEAALVLARRSADPLALGLALVGAADGHFRQGALDRAQALAEEAVAVYEPLSDARGLALAWGAIGNVRWTQGRMPEALELYEKSLEFWRSAGDREGMARALNNIGEVKRNTGAGDEALACFEEARDIFEGADDRRRAAVVIDNIAIVYFWRGEYPEALAQARRALEMREALGDRYGVGKSLDTVGNIYRAQGDYARALDCFHRALRLRAAVRDRHGVVETAHNLGLVYSAQGDHAHAIDAYKRGLRLNAGLGDASFQAEALLNIGAAAWRLGQRARAEANLRASLAIAEQQDLGFLKGEILQGLAEVALQGGRTRQARALLERAQTERERTRDQAGLSAVFASLGSLAIVEGKPQQAAELAGRAADIARTYEQPERLLEAETVRGIALRREGRLAEAQRALADAITVVEGLRLNVGGGAAGRERFLEERLSPYDELVALAVARGSAAEALETAERSKARELSELMRRGRPNPSKAMTSGERTEARRLRGNLLSLNERLQAERGNAAPDQARIASLEAELRVRRAEHEAFQDALVATHPELRRERGEETPFTLVDAPAVLLDDGTAVLEYVVTEEATFVFVLSREHGQPSVASYTVPRGAAALAALVDRFRERIAARTLAFAEDGRRLYDVLLAPARDRLAGKTRVVVVPDGPLWSLPFQALVDASGRYLIESAAVTYAPSLTVLRETARRPPAGDPPALLAMGKADSASPLPEAERQVRLIAALYGAGRATVYLGAEAREDRFKAEASHYSVVHLASHGVLDPVSPLYSHVVLSPGAGASREDGLLEAWELLDMELHADVVVLSACETGRGRIARGEGVVGMMWAFFVAGARSLVVSQWNVEATSTTDLMTGLHRGLVSAPGRAAEGLRQASLALLRSRRFAHPFYWAGFALVGSPY